MQVLFVYGTTEGQTHKIADFCGKRLVDQGHEVDLYDIGNRRLSREISDFEAVVLAGSVHQERHQEDLENFVFARKQELRTLPSLLISVSLSIAFENGKDAAEGYVRSFVRETEFTPTDILLLGGALKFDKYGYYMNQIIEHVVLKDREMITEDREFTDWELLKHTLDAFVAR